MAITITTQPETTVGTLGAQTTLTAAATGETSVQWQRYTTAWGDLSGQTSDTLTISTLAIGDCGYQYRAVYGDGSTTLATNAAYILATTLPAGTYDATDWARNINAVGSRAVTISGANTFGGVYPTIDNPDLDVSGAGSIDYVSLKRFKRIHDLGTLGGSLGSRTGCVIFPNSCDLSGITDPTIENTTVPGSIHFGDVVEDDGYSGTFAKHPTPVTDGLLIYDCVLQGGLYGRCTGVTFQLCTGTMSNTPNAKAMSFGGNDITMTACDFDVTWNECMWKVNAGRGWGKSIKGLKVIDCIFTGGHEEMLGYDSPVPIFNGHVTAVGTSTLTVAVDLNPSGLTQLSGTTAQVGRHVLIDEGAGHGNYYEIIAQNGSVLTLDSTHLALWPVEGVVEVGDRMTVSCALVESEWTNVTAYHRGSFYDFGMGTSIALSMWGNCLGNIVTNFHSEFASPNFLTSAPDGAILVTEASGYATMVNDCGLSFPAWYGMNSRNVYDSCSQTGGSMMVGAATLFFDSRGEQLVQGTRPYDGGTDVPVYSSGIQVIDCTSDNGAASELIDYKNAFWASPEATFPTTVYTGKTPHDATKSPAIYKAMTYGNYYQEFYTEFPVYFGRPPGIVFDGVTYPKQISYYSEPNWLWAYELPLGHESETTLSYCLATADADSINLDYPAYTVLDPVLTDTVLAGVITTYTIEREEVV